MSRTIENIGLTMLRWGSKRPVLLQRPPSWTVQYLRPLASRQATNQRGAYWLGWHLADEEGQPALLRQCKRQCHQGHFALKLRLTLFTNAERFLRQRFFRRTVYLYRRRAVLTRNDVNVLERELNLAISNMRKKCTKKEMSLTELDWLYKLSVKLKICEQFMTRIKQVKSRSYKGQVLPPVCIFGKQCLR